MGDIPDWIDASELAWARSRAWALTPWRPADAWRPLNNPQMWTNRQPEDTAGWERIPGGWDHEHCRLCTERIFESGDPATSQAYTDGVDWICPACHGLIFET
jgi:hypothetical protein